MIHVSTGLKKKTLEAKRAIESAKAWENSCKFVYPNRHLCTNNICSASEKFCRRHEDEFQESQERQFRAQKRLRSASAVRREEEEMEEDQPTQHNLGDFNR